MRRFWSDLISSLYSIRDGIIKKKQEDEAEKEELRNQIAELEQNSNNSQDSIVVEPFAMLQFTIGGIPGGLNEGSNIVKTVKRFDKSFIDYDRALALYKIEDFKRVNDNNSLSVEGAVVPNSDNLSLKDNKIYFLKCLSRQLYAPNAESPVFAQILYTNGTGSYPHYEPRPFVQNGQAFDCFDTEDYTINLESLQIGDGLEVEDLNNLYFIIGTNIS